MSLGCKTGRLSCVKLVRRGLHQADVRQDRFGTDSIEHGCSTSPVFSMNHVRGVPAERRHKCVKGPCCGNRASTLREASNTYDRDLGGPYSAGVVGHLVRRASEFLRAPSLDLGRPRPDEPTATAGDSATQLQRVQGLSSVHLSASADTVSPPHVPTVQHKPTRLTSRIGT